MPMPMLVRLKKRGPWPHQDRCTPGTHPLPLNAFRGMCVEVEPTTDCAVPGGEPLFGCGAPVYGITDRRLMSPNDPTLMCICSHFLIDDLEAFESDYEDEQAEVGDLVTAGAVYAGTAKTFRVTPLEFFPLDKSR